MQKNRNKLVCFLTLAFWLATFLLPQNSFAAGIPTSPPPTVGADGTVCPDSHKGLVVRIVPCIRNTVLYATTQMFVPITKIVAKLVTAASTLAIVLWGIRVMLGHPVAVTRDGFVLAIKIGVVGLFSSQYPYLFPKMIAIMDGLINIVAKPAADMVKVATSCQLNFTGTDAKMMMVFGSVDCYLDNLVGGIFQPAGIKNGIVGFLFSLIFSNVAGFFMGAICFYLIYLSIMTIAKSLYIFIMAFIAFSLMSILSPIFVPMILFKQTTKYFTQWADLSISFIVQPVMLMAYLTMFLMAFNVTVFHSTHSLYYAIAGEASIPNDKTADFKIGDWLSQKGVYAVKSLNSKGNVVDPKNAKQAMGADATIDKGVVSKQGQHPECEGSITTDCVKMNTVNAVTNSMGFGDVSGLPNKAMNFFRVDTPIQTLDWAKLSKIVDATGCDAVHCDNTDATGEDKKAIDKYLSSRKVKVFMTFIMSLITMYVFFTLLEQIPMIGSGLIGEIGSKVNLGGQRPQAASRSGGQ